MNFETIKTAVDGRIGILTLSRARILNAIDSRMVGELGAALRQHATDPQVLAIVLHGEGRAFSAGFDLKESAARQLSGVEQWRAVLQQDFDFIAQFWDCP